MTIQRREFLQAIGSASLAGSLITYTSAAAVASSAVPAFGFSDDRVPMNAANLCPMLSSVSDAHARYASELDLDLSSANRKRIEAMKEAARTRIAGLLGTSADELAIVRTPPREIMSSFRECRLRPATRSYSGIRIIRQTVPRGTFGPLAAVSRCVVFRCRRTRAQLTKSSTCSSLPSVTGPRSWLSLTFPTSPASALP